MLIGTLGATFLGNMFPGEGAFGVVKEKNRAGLNF